MRERFDQQDWLALLGTELAHAGVADPDLVAFQIDAVLCAANTALRLGDTQAVDKIRRVVNGFLS